MIHLTTIEKRHMPIGLCNNNNKVLAPITELFRKKVVINKISNEVYQDPILPLSLCSLLEATLKQAHVHQVTVSNTQNYTLPGPHPAESGSLSQSIGKIALALTRLLLIPTQITSPKEIWCSD